MIGQAAQLLLNLNSNGGLTFNHILIIKGGQEMRTLFCTKILRRLKGFVKIIPDQPHLDVITAKHSGFQDLLLGRGDRHEHHTMHFEMLAHKGDALGVIARRGTDKHCLIRDHLAHRVERPAQLVRPHRAEILTLEPDVSTKAFRQHFVAHQRRFGKHLPHLGCCQCRHRLKIHRHNTASACVFCR